MGLKQTLKLIITFREVYIKYMALTMPIYSEL